MGNQNFVSSEIHEKALGSMSELTLKSVDERFNSKRDLLNRRALKLGHSKLYLPSFDGNKFIDHLKANLEKEDVNQDEILKDLPIVKKKYRIQKVLGIGNFGSVLMCSDVGDPNICVVVKSISVSRDFSMKVESEDIQEDLYRRMRNELEILPQLTHPNITTYIESFLVEKPPLYLPTMKTKDTPCDKLNLCIVTKYIPGSNLEKILEYSEKKRVSINPIISIKWFINLLETVNFLHKNKIIHRQLVASNILVAYENLSELKKMELILSSFGVGKKFNEIKQEYKSNKKNKDKTPVELFFASPEVIKNRDWSLSNTEKFDVWSIGILFFQLYNGLSSKSFKLRVKQIQSYLLGRNFQISYIFEGGQFHEKIIKPFLDSDKAIGVVCKKIFCEEQFRASCEELLELKTIKTWKYFIELQKKFNPKFMDFNAVVTLLRVIKDEEKVYKRILNVFSYEIDRKRGDELKKIFEKEDCLRLICAKLLLFEKRKSVIKLFIEFSTKILSIEKFRKYLLFLMRDYCIIEILQQSIINFTDRSINIFCYKLVKENRPILLRFKEIALSLLDKYFQSRSEILKSMLQLIFPLVDLIRTNDIIIQKINSENCEDDLLLFERVNWSDLKESTFNLIINRILLKISSLLLVKNEEGKIIKFFQMMLCLMMQRNKKIHDLQFHESFRPKINSLDLFYENKVMPNVHLDEKTNEIHATQHLKHLKKIRSKRNLDIQKMNLNLETVIISAKPLCEFKKEEGEEKVLGYYEIKLDNSGVNDFVEFGINVNQEKSYFVNGPEKVIKISSREEDDDDDDIEEERLFMEPKKFTDYKELLTFTEETAGIGVTTKGNIFYTKNNHLYPFFKIDLKDGDLIYSHFRVAEHHSYSIKVNFFEKENKFYFNFKEQKKRIGSIKKRFKLEKKVKRKLMEIIKSTKDTKNEKLDIVLKICDQIEKILKNRLHEVDDQNVLDEMVKYYL